MRSLTSKIALHKAVGLCLGEREVTVSEVAAGPLGPMEVASASSTYADEDLGATIQRLLKPFLAQRKRMPVAVGLPNSRLFFASRPAAASGETIAPEAVLQKALCSPNVCIDDLSVEMLSGTVGKTPVRSVAACKKKYLSVVIAVLEQLGVRPVRSEPSSLALLRLAARRHRAPRRAKTLLRVFLGDDLGLAVLLSGTLVLAWRQFALPAGEEGDAMLATIRALGTQHRHYGVQSPLDCVMVHGRADLHERLHEVQFASKLDARVIWCDDPPLDGRSTAFGLALGCLAQKAKTFDLSRTMKTRASIREIFPWWDLAYAVMLVICMGMALEAHSVQLDDACVAAQAKSSDHKCLASADARQLEKETKELETKVEAVRLFVGTRILWTAYTRDVSVRLPTDALLVMFEGINDLNTGGRGSRALGKSLQLRAMVPCGPDGSTPRDIDVFLDALRNHPLLKRDFPSVELADIKRSKPVGMDTPVATFSIVCLPGKKGTQKGKTE